MAELFDDISRIIGNRMPRRRALKLIMGLFAGGALGLVGASPVAAQTLGKCYVRNPRDTCQGDPGPGTWGYQYCCQSLEGRSWCPLKYVQSNGTCQAGRCLSCLPPNSNPSRARP
jgi:hypothetical protein